MRDFVRRSAFQLARLGFRLLPLPTGTRDRWRLRFLDRHGEWVPAGPRGQLPQASRSEHRPRRHAASRAVGYVEHRPGTLPSPLPATVVAFYLPQFHPIPENDAWWGEGFTEWHNVTRALPQFEGHAQPRLPGALGFYDLRLGDAMRSQMQLAREYGIGAFCSYFYWFAGKRLLEQPLQQWLADPTLELPLCLCWANENWSRRWDGRADDILIGQQHSAADDLAFIEYASRYLRDPRYLRVQGRPLLLVYRPGLLPDPKATAQRWRDWCRTHDVGEIELAYVQSFDRVAPCDIGFDAAVEFPPNNTTLTPITGRQQLLDPDYRGDVFDWRALVEQSKAQPDPPYPRYPGVNSGWDNEPRRSGGGRVFAHASPRGYRDWLRHAIVTARRRFPVQPLVFVNAWNEWAEGAVLEPDARLGHAWLQATRNALQPDAHAESASTAHPCAVVHVWYVDVLEEIAAALQATGIHWRIVITTAPEREQAVRQRAIDLGMQAEIAVFENRGRDILPFLQVAGRLLGEGVELVLKLHTKRSTHRQDGSQWRKDLFDRLLAPRRAVLLRDAFARDRSLGLIAAEGHLQPLSYYWGANRETVGYLATRLGLPPPDTERDSFIAGSMYWVRLVALRPLLDAHLDLWEFEDEAGQLDGTFAHAIERVVALAARHAGFGTTDAASVCGEPVAAGRYPYARRGS